MLYDIMLYCHGDEHYLIECDSRVTDDIIKHLRKYALRSKVCLYGYELLMVLVNMYVQKIILCTIIYCLMMPYQKLSFKIINFFVCIVWLLFTFCGCGINNSFSSCVNHGFTLFFSLSFFLIFMACLFFNIYFCFYYLCYDRNSIIIIVSPLQ